MEKVQTGVVQDDSTAKFVAYLDGAVVRTSKTREGAEYGLKRAIQAAKRAGKQVIEPKADTTQLPEESPEVVKYQTPVMNPQTAVYVPEKDVNFIPFGEFKELNTIIKSRAFFPVFISGPTGNGKSTMVEQSCARNGRTYIRLQMNAQTDEDQLIGSKTLVDGNIQIVEGPVLIAMRTGSVLLLDEIDACDPNAALCLQSILEGKPYYFKLKNEMVHPAPGFNIIATANTKGRGSDSGKYIGTKMLNEAFLERFPLTFEQEYPTMSIELKIVRGAMEKFGCMDEKFATTLVKWSDVIRRTYDDGALDDLITTRRLIHIVQAYGIFKDTKLAVRLACNRFDALTKSTFIEVFDKITPDETPVVEEPAPVTED